MLIRIVDIGSNSIKASIYDVQNGSHKGPAAAAGRTLRC